MLVGEAALAEHALAVPHWHLGLLATDPDYRGRGFARAVLEPILRLATQDEYPVSLETAVSENLAFYSQFWLRDTRRDRPSRWGPSRLDARAAVTTPDLPIRRGSG